MKAAETALEGAIAQLSFAGSVAGENEDLVANAESTENAATESGNVASGNTAKSAKTGDATNVAVPAAAAAALVRRKRR